MTILLTGSSGLIGKQFLNKIKKNDEVVTISKQGDDKNNLIIDLSEQIKINLLPSKCDTVVHLAQSPYYKEFPNKALNVFNVNVATTQVLLDYAINAGATKFVLASSGGVYGTGDKAFNELDPIYTKETLGHYLSTKLCMEVLAKSYSNFIDVIVLRFFFVYGPGQKRIMLIPRLVDSVLNGNAIKLQGLDGIKINPIHADDAANSIISALRLDGSHTFNIAGMDVLSLREIGEQIGKVVDKEPIFEVDESVRANHLMGDITKMSSLLNQPEIRFYDGIKTIINI